jgi:glutathione S-transferase
MALYHIPVCPFSQRVEILLALKELRGAVRFHVVDITRPRPQWLLAKSGGTTALPILETEDGHVIKESLVILQYIEDRFPERPVAQRDPYRRAVENMLTPMEGPFGRAGYGYVMNQAPERRDALRHEMLEQYAGLNAFLVQHAAAAPYLFDAFGWAEAVFTPLFMRFWFLDYYEGFELPNDERFARVREWHDACIAHAAAQQVTQERIVKLYYDYAKGAGNGALLPGRRRSSFAFEPDWRERPWPPRDKYSHSATDEELGL